MGKPILRIICVCAVAVIATACGGDSGTSLSDDENDFVDSMMAEFDTEEAEPVTEDEVRCYMEGIVDEFGVDGLTDMGFPSDGFAEEAPFPDVLTEEAAGKVFNHMDDCLDIAGLFLEGMEADADLSEEAKDCLADAFTADVIRDFMIASMVGGDDVAEQDPEIMAKMLETFAKCPDAMPAMGG